MMDALDEFKVELLDNGCLIGGDLTWVSDDPTEIGMIRWFAVALIERTRQRDEARSAAVILQRDENTFDTNGGMYVIEECWPWIRDWPEQYDSLPCHWLCQHCGQYNDPAATTCEKCGKANPEVV